MRLPFLAEVDKHNVGGYQIPYRELDDGENHVVHIARSNDDATPRA